MTPPTGKRGQCRQCGGRFPLLAYSPRSKKSHLNGHLADHPPAYKPDGSRCDGSGCAPGRPAPLVVCSKHPKYVEDDDSMYWVHVSQGQFRHACTIRVRNHRLSKTMRRKLYRAITRAVEDTIHPYKPLRAWGLSD